MCSWVYTWFISRWGVWIIWWISTPKNVYLRLKKLDICWRLWSRRNCDEIDIPHEDIEDEEFSVCEEKRFEDFEAWRFIISVSFSSQLSHRDTVLLKGVEVTLRNEFPHDAQPKPNPTKSLKWGIWETWGLSQLRVPTVTTIRATSLILSTPTVIIFKGIYVKICRDAPRL